LDTLNGERRKLNNEIAEKKKAKQEKEAEELIAKRNAIEEQIEVLKKKVIECEKEVGKILYRIGNIVHNTVVVSKTEVRTLNNFCMPYSC
jgi:seryl-tRNA synthetase